MVQSHSVRAYKRGRRVCPYILEQIIIKAANPCPLTSGTCHMFTNRLSIHDIEPLKGSSLHMQGNGIFISRCQTTGSTLANSWLWSYQCELLGRGVRRTHRLSFTGVSVASNEGLIPSCTTERLLSTVRRVRRTTRESLAFLITKQSAMMRVGRLSPDMPSLITPITPTRQPSGSTVSSHPETAGRSQQRAGSSLERMRLNGPQQDPRREMVYHPEESPRSLTSVRRQQQATPTL